MKGCAAFPVLVATVALLALGGCVSFATLAKDAATDAAIDASSAPLGVQAAENFHQAQQSRGFRVGYTVRFQ